MAAARRTDRYIASSRLTQRRIRDYYRRESEVVYWLPDHKAVAVGDVLLGAGAKPKATSEPLRLCPERWLGDANYRKLKKSLLPLLELPLQRILLSHGEPVLADAKDTLAALVETPKKS